MRSAVEAPPRIRAAGRGGGREPKDKFQNWARPSPLRCAALRCCALLRSRGGGATPREWSCAACGPAERSRPPAARAARADGRRATPVGTPVAWLGARAQAAARRVGNHVTIIDTRLGR
eukprot:scaffold932_cov299-Prasinococcus_capsulatus_cf.AAC.4